MVRRVVEVCGKFWQSGGFDHPSDPDLITCCRPLTSRVRIPHAVNVLRQTLNAFTFASVAQLVSAFDCYKCLKKAKSSKG